jgi:hypothetical protein
LLGFWGDDPDIVGDAARDVLQDCKTRGMDAVIVGAQNAHA